jgi:branched-chain amino acid transport system substrate-binding protein
MRACELVGVTRDKVDLLGGFGLTPNALAVAPVATEAKTPMVIMKAATSVITTRSPYIVRLSHTLPQDTVPIAQWAKKNGVSQVFTLVSDYGPGIDAETAFVKAFKAAGGEIVASVRTPLQDAGFAPFLQRIKDAKPQAVFVFLPPGNQTIAFIKAYYETNGTRLRPNFMACAGFDGMAAIAEALKKTQGSTDADKLLAAFKGMKLSRPRGPIMIDPETRDIVQTVYIRKVEKVDGQLYNVEFHKFPDVKDPGKQP